MSTTENVARTERQIVAFCLAEETYGVDIGSIREVIPVQKIIPVPRAPEFVEGIINLRGKVIPVLDLRQHFGFEKKPKDPNQRIMLTEVDGDSIGVIVDMVSSVMRIPEESIEPPATVIIGQDIKYIQGIAKVDDKLLVLLDLTRIINDAEQRTLQEIDLASVLTDEGI